MSSTKFFYCLIAMFFLSVNSYAQDFSEAEVLDTYDSVGVPSKRLLDSQFSGSSMRESVDPFTGQLKIIVSDLFIPGEGGLDINIQRNYRSFITPSMYNFSFPYEDPLGVRWSMHFGRLLFPGGTPPCFPNINTSINTNFVLELPDGSRHTLAHPTTTDYPIDLKLLSDNSWKAECNLSSGSVEAFSPDGTKYIFGLKKRAENGKDAYHVTRIEDVNGNWLSFEYLANTSPATITKITSNDGRRVNFNYESYTTNRVTPAKRLSSITYGDRTITYIYTQLLSSNTYYTLTKVIRPDSSTWNYSYGADRSTPFKGYASIVEIRTPEGAKYNYAYDGVQLAQKRAPGREGFDM